MVDITKEYDNFGHYEYEVNALKHFLKIMIF